MSKIHLQELYLTEFRKAAFPLFFQALKERDGTEIKKITAQAIQYKTSLKLYDALLVSALNPGNTELATDLLGSCSEGETKIDFMLHSTIKAQLTYGSSDTAVAILKSLKENFNYLPHMFSIEHFNDLTVAKFYQNEFFIKTNYTNYTNYFDPAVITNISERLVADPNARALILEDWAQKKGLDTSKTYILFRQDKLAPVIKQLPLLMDKLPSFNLLIHDGGHHRLLHCETTQKGEYIFFLGDSILGNKRALVELKTYLPKEVLKNSYFFSFDLQRQHTSMGCMFFTMNDLEVILKNPDLIQKIVNNGSKESLVDNGSKKSVVDEYGEVLFDYSSVNSILSKGIPGTEKFMKLVQSLNNLKQYLNDKKLDQNFGDLILNEFGKVRDKYGIKTPSVKNDKTINNTVEYYKAKTADKIADLLDNLTNEEVEEIIKKHSVEALWENLAETVAVETASVPVPDILIAGGADTDNIDSF